MKRIHQLNMQAPHLHPGSPGALAHGCTCPPADRGIDPSRPHIFRADWKCPLHGPRALLDKDERADDKNSSAPLPQKLN